jgi:hypothetical protein
VEILSRVIVSLFQPGLPARVSIAKDQEGNEAHDHIANNEKPFEEKKRANFELGWGDEADEKSEGGAESAHGSDKPDAGHFVGDSVGSDDVRAAVAELDRSQEHQYVHDEIELSRNGAQDPKGAARRWHEEEDEGGDRHDDALKEEKIGWHAMAVELLK